MSVPLAQRLREAAAAPAQTAEPVTVARLLQADWGTAWAMRSLN